MKAHAVATALAAKESQDKKAKEEAAAAAAAYQKHMMEEDDAFRGVHLKDHAHWDEVRVDTPLHCVFLLILLHRWTMMTTLEMW